MFLFLYPAFKYWCFFGFYSNYFSLFFLYTLFLNSEYHFSMEELMISSFRVWSKPTFPESNQCFIWKQNLDSPEKTCPSFLDISSSISSHTDNKSRRLWVIFVSLFTLKISSSTLILTYCDSKYIYDFPTFFDFCCLQSGRNFIFLTYSVFLPLLLVYLF